jgi:ATP-dependent helicase HrpB
VSLLPLPIDEILPQLITALRGHPCAVLRAPTGAGKTSRVPPAILDAGLADRGQVIVLQPRRVAARAAAWRIAEERGCRLGEEVGFQVRFEREVGPSTRIVVETEGVFVRQLAEDPYLEGIGAVVFDEFHERSLNTDVALAMVRKVQREVRPDLKIVVMSATLATQEIARYLGDCPILESAGRLYPVEISYLQHAPHGPLDAHIMSAIEQALARTAGDLLVFLPGVGEIRRIVDALQNLASEQNLAVVELYGDLPLEQQHAALRPANRRKVVLSTNVAETSVTIEGVTGVVDGGEARILRLDPALGLNRLEVVRISRASADQRAGRAGRTAPGVCLRLWTEREQAALQAEETPEILRVDLAGPVLELMCWGEADVRAFPWFEAPPAATLDQALTLLRDLGAVHDGVVTSVGQNMARLPVHPRIARLLLEGQNQGYSDRAALLGALLSERDPFPRPRGAEARQTSSHHSDSDLLDRLAILEEFARAGGRHSRSAALNVGAARFVLRARDQLKRLLREELGNAPKPQTSADEAMLRAIWTAFPDRVARRREAGGRRGVMVGGRGVRLTEQSAVMDAELFVCVDLQEIGQSESLVRLASAVDREWLPPERLHTSIEIEFDRDRERILAKRRTRFDDLVLDDAVTNVPPDADVAPILAREAAERLDLSQILGPADKNFLARVQCLSVWMPELQLPSLGDDPVRTLLPRLCEGCYSFADLRRVQILPVLQSLLSYQQLQALDREAPGRLTVPSGSSIELEYAVGKSPILAVRIQEIFGMKQTPRIAGGRVNVLLHLLAPNMRPQQVTTDLESFWKNTYPLVRGELRRRYPKHAWPEDPTTAQPERRPQRKM